MPIPQIARTPGDRAITESMVQLVDPDGRVRGCGLLVGPGHVITCAHVVALAVPDVEAGQAEQPSQKVLVRFPYSRRRKLLSARVEVWKPLIETRPASSDAARDGADFVEDVAVLVLDEPAPEQAVPHGILGLTEWAGRSYMAQGFTEKEPKGAWADGYFKGKVVDGWVQLLSHDGSDLQVDEGFSGGGVWDATMGGFAGIMVANRKRGGHLKPVSYMIPGTLLKEAWSALPEGRPATGGDAPGGGAPPGSGNSYVITNKKGNLTTGHHSPIIHYNSPGRLVTAIAVLILVVLAALVAYFALFYSPVSAWQEFEAPAKAKSWKNVIQDYRTRPPAVESRITYDEAKARSKALGDKGLFYPAIAAAELALRKKPDDFELQAKIGEYFVAEGDYDEARKAKQDAIERLKSRKLDRSTFATEAAPLYLQLGNVNERSREKEKAREAYKHAETYAKESCNRKVLDAIAAKRAALGEAEDVVKAAADDYDRAKANFGEYSEECATKVNNLALAYWKIKKYKDAERTFLDVVKILEKLKWKFPDGIKLAMAHVNLGMVCEDQKEYDKADSALSKALAILGPSQNVMGFNALYNFTKAAIARGDKARAREWWTRARDYLAQLKERPQEESAKDLEDLERLREEIEGAKKAELPSRARSARHLSSLSDQDTLTRRVGTGGPKWGTFHTCSARDLRDISPGLKLPWGRRGLGPLRSDRVISYFDPASYALWV